MKLFDKDWWKQQLYKEHVIELNELNINNPNRASIAQLERWEAEIKATDNLKIKQHLALKCAEGVLWIWQKHHPNDQRPQNAITALKTYLKNPSEENKQKCKDAADDAYDAYDAAYDAWAAADAADAAYAAADAAYAAYAAVYAADTNVAYYATNAAYYAIRALKKEQSLNELQINKPKQYIPIIKPTKPEYITNAKSFRKLTNYFENTNLKLQKEIGRLNVDSVSEIGGIQFPLTIDEASKIILVRWFFENIDNYYMGNFNILDKWWDKSKICLADLERNLNELEINKPLKFPIKIPQQWNEKTVGDIEELEQLFIDFAKLNPSLFKYIDLKYIIDIEKSIVEYEYPLSSILTLWEGIVEGIWFYCQQTFASFYVEFIPFKNLIAKQFDNRLIDFNEIKLTFNLNKLNELGINKPKEIEQKPFTQQEFDNLKGLIKKIFGNRLKDFNEFSHYRKSNMSMEDFYERYGNRKNIFQYGTIYPDAISFGLFIENVNYKDKQILDKLLKKFTKRHNFRGIANVNIYPNIKWEFEKGTGGSTNTRIGIYHRYTNMSGRLHESKQSIKYSFREFIKFLQQELPIKEKYNIKLTKDKSKTTSFAHFNPSNNEIVVYIKGRNLMDSWRSLAHEWCHLHQNINNELTDTSGEDGSDHENQANAFAGLIMRKWGKLHPEYYTQLVENKVNELEINRPPKIWDLMKEGVKFENIKVGDILQFMINPGPETVKQKVIEIYNKKLKSQDLDKNGNLIYNAIDYWESSSIEMFWEREGRTFSINESAENEIFSAYHGRYKFDVSKAYNLIKQGKIKTKIKTYSPKIMHFLSHPEFSEASPEKYNKININYNKPLGLIANFKDEDGKNELILIDGNHRTRKAVGEGKEGKYIVMYNPNDVEKILTTNNKIPKKLFSDDE